MLTDLQWDEHRRCVEFDRRQWELSSLIAILGDKLENLTDACKNDEAPVDEELSAGEAAAREAPAKEAATVDETMRYPDIKGPATGVVHPDKEDEGKKVTTGYNLRVPATEAGLGSHFNPDAAATAEQVHIQGVDEDSVVGKE